MGRVQEKLRKLSTAHLRQKVEALQEIDREMREAQEQRADAYDQATAPLRESAAEHAKLAMEQALKEQHAAIAALKQYTQGVPVVESSYQAMLESLPTPEAILEENL